MPLLFRNYSDVRTSSSNTTAANTTAANTTATNTKTSNNKFPNNEYTAAYYSGETPFSFPNTSECYACTQVGVPTFHSTICNHLPHEAAGDTSNKANQKFYRAAERILGPILDPRSETVRVWNRAITIARVISLAVDPVFFYTLSIGLGGAPCLVLQHLTLVIVTIIRTCVDAVHLCHIWLQFRLAYISKESLIVGCGKLVWDPRAIASRYVCAFEGFLFDIFVILPVPQVIFWTLVPKLVREQRINRLTIILIVIFLLQILPKAYHTLSLRRGMRKVTGYVFGTIWWGFAFSLVAFFVVSHIFGGIWYMLSIQRVGSCLSQRCSGCDLSLPCSTKPCYYSGDCPDSLTNKFAMCFDIDGPFKFGIYDIGVAVISSYTFPIKILYPHVWGLYQLSTFGNNLFTTEHWSEVLLCIIMVVGGLTLFTSMCGNIQVFLQAILANKSVMRLRCQDMEWWMRRRQLPNRLRQRVHKFESQSRANTGGLNEMELIKDLPDGLRRDIKRYLCIDLVKKVPVFQCLDDLILDNICDRVKPLFYSKNDKIVREGDPIIQMVFIVHGRIKSSQCISKGFQAISILEPGGFFGDELLSWCLRKPFIHRLPTSSATFVCLQSTEAFAIDAHDLRYITEHFRYKFANDRLKWTIRYYSANWRTWAAVNIQLAWRRYVKRTRNSSLVTRENGGDDHINRLRRVAAMFMGFRPHDHLD